MILRQMGTDEKAAELYDKVESFSAANQISNHVALPAIGRGRNAWKIM